MEYFLQHTLFWKNGVQFSCTQCSACCRYDPGFVYLSAHDLDKLQEWAGVERFEFIKKFCRWVLQGDGMSTFAFRNGQIMTVFYGIMAVLHIIIDLFNALPIHFGIIFWKQNSIGMQMPKAVRE